LLNLYPDEIRFFFALGKQEVYLSLIECLIKLGKIEESFLANSRALHLLNQRIVFGKTGRKNVPEKYLQTRTRLRGLIKEFSRIPQPGQRQLESVQKFRKTEENLWHTEKKIRAIMYPAGISGGSELLSQDYYRKYLRPDEILVNYIILGEKLSVYKVCHNKVELVDLKLTHSELTTYVRELHFLMEKSIHSSADFGNTKKIIEDYQRILWEALISPLNIDNSQARLIFLINDIFAQVPLGALLDSDNNLLYQKFDFNLISNPIDLANRKDNASLKASAQAAIFAPENSGLPMVSHEVERIKSLYRRADLYAGEAASCNKLLTRLGDTDGFVHIATHASRSSENPLFSRILMSDGPFFPFDLFGARIKSTLVTLSGCQTAAPGIYYGNSFSLAKAFYQAGARYVLASLWPISDKVSLVFMNEFYANLNKNGDISRAYRAATHKTRAINFNPAFWSPFVLLGI